MRKNREAATLETPIARHAAAIGGVAALHIALLAFLATTGTLPPLLPAVLPARLILEPLPPPPMPRPLRPTIEAPAAMSVPIPDISIAAPPPDRPAAPRGISRTGRPANHFGAATDSGLGLDVASAAGGGAGTRGSLAGFEAAVRQRVLAGKRQPSLAWDRRNTCVVNYRVMVARGGGLAGFSIAPCAVPEINKAARDAISGAGPFPPPPDLNAATYEVHGSLVFHP